MMPSAANAITTRDLSVGCMCASEQQCVVSVREREEGERKRKRREKEGERKKKRDQDDW